MIAQAKKVGSSRLETASEDVLEMHDYFLAALRAGNDVRTELVTAVQQKVTDGAYDANEFKITIAAQRLLDVIDHIEEVPPSPGSPLRLAA